MSKRSLWSYLLYGIVALVPFSAGVYVLLEKKMYIGGRLSAGAVYEYEYPANIIMAVSFFLFTAFILSALFNYRYKKQVCEVSFISAIILFFVGTLM